ncbi:MAG: GtrA family protein [Provencibacterium sp.]|nr:GtrA family protein [Provencibacterium sp.]
MKKLWDFGMSLFNRYKEVILYLIFGGLTTLVNIVSYALFADWLGIYYLTANVIAWILSVLFAYLTNRSFVFESKSQGRAALRELLLFFGCRLLSGLFDMACMYVCVDLLQMPGLAAKILSNVIVIILNYLFSKFLIFQKKEN